MSKDVLEVIAKHYPLTPTRWKQPNELFESDCGMKRVLFWTDETLMKWHHSLRNHLENEEVFVDRMHMTLDGNWNVPIEEGILTIHDAYFEPYPKKNHEHVWGRFLGDMLTLGMEQTNADSSYTSTVDMIEEIEGLSRSDPAIAPIRKSFPEAQRRIKMVRTIYDRHQHLQKPKLDATLSLNQGKRVHGHLFWQCGNHYPESNLQGVASFLSDWHQSTDTKSTHALLDHINDRFTITDGYDQLIVAELIAPREVQRCVKRLENTDFDQSEQILHRFEQEWESNLRLVEDVYEWINHRSKKVMR